MSTNNSSESSGTIIDIIKHVMLGSLEQVWFYYERQIYLVGESRGVGVGNGGSCVTCGALRKEAINKRL